MNNKTIKILLADDFWTEWELYETSNKDQFVREAAAMLNDRGEGIDETTSRILLSSTSDDDLEEARSQADEILYASTLYDDDNDDKYLPF